jgi:hypothetical protein
MSSQALEATDIPGLDEREEKLSEDVSDIPQ